QNALQSVDGALFGRMSFLDESSLSKMEVADLPQCVQDALATGALIDRAALMAQRDSRTPTKRTR
ncbi:unnamed protein product, partial [Amoebophrya sp. A25]